MNEQINTFLQGDALAVLKTLPDNFVQCVVTSPPYYRLRSYLPDGHSDKYLEIGLEVTPQEFVTNLVKIFREVRRVLRSDGTLWLNLGDTYSNDRKWGGHASGKHRKELHEMERPRRYTGLPGKNLLMVPSRVAIALQDDGWILRSDIIWHKLAAMPESVEDRPTSAHEHVFLFAKSEQYFYDTEAIKEPSVSNHPSGNGFKRDARLSYLNPDGSARGNDSQWQISPTRNRRNVWSLSAQPYPEAHFATMPPKLIEPCILAGTSPKACEHCNTAWKRKVARTDPVKMAGPNHTKSILAQNQGGPTGKTSMLYSGHVYGRETVGWEPACTCANNTGSGKCIVLDPFSGAGTTALVALQHGRNYLGIELNPDYITLARKRIATIQPNLWTTNGGVA
jgi:DNA modification methylase